jgi:hypothetical protein
MTKDAKGWRRSSTGVITQPGTLEKKKPYVNHYSFHISDRDWGHVTIKISGHPPFPAQAILNGHEYVACQSRKVGIGFAKEGNFVTAIAGTAGLAKIAETLSEQRAVGRLSEACERWIYRCYFSPSSTAIASMTGYFQETKLPCIENRRSKETSGLHTIRNERGPFCTPLDSNPRDPARDTASVRVLTASFEKMRLTYDFTVSGEISRVRAMRLLAKPWLIIASTSRSRAVSVSLTRLLGCSGGLPA